MQQQVEVLSDTIRLPKRIGRIEEQASALGVDIFDQLLGVCHRKALEDASGTPIFYAGHHYERVQDGAGTWHYNLYAYYDPVGAQEELPPRNLNNAEQNVLGQVLNESNLGDIGFKEQRF